MSNLTVGSQRAAGIALKTREDRPGEPPMIRGGQVFALASSEGRLFVPMVSVDPGEPKITGSYGSTEVPIKPFVGVVDLVSTRELRIGVPSQTSALHRACMLPRAAAAAPGGKLFVACAGIDELLELDGRADNAARAPHRRVRLPSGPVGLALDGTEVVVLSQFDREVSIVPLAEGGEVVRVGLSRPVAAADEAFERGRKIFHDSFDVRVSADGRACASCHPDGRDDGNTWSTPDGPRQTPSLAGRIAGSGPYGWFGRHPTLDSHLAETMHRLGGRGFAGKGDRADLAALETYLTKMKAPVVPTVDDPRVRVGRALFHDAKQGCGTCHAEGSTDRVRHDVGSGHAEESSMQFDTPSLAFVSATAPYFHDGRYATLDELLAKGNDRMGHAKHLDADQRASLVAYMDSLAPRAEPGSELAPVSFTAAGPLRPLTPEAASPLERLLLDAEGPPRVFRDVDFDIATVPVVSVSKVPEWNAKSAEAQGSALPSGEIVWNHGCAAVPHHAAAHLSFDWRSTSMTSRLERCVYAPDPNGFFYWSDASMTTIDPLPNGNLHVVTRQAFIRLTSNEIRVAREISVEATRLADGLVFAYRTKCDDCKEDERDQLHLVMPSDAQTIFDTIALNLARGTAGHTSTSVTPSVLSSWTTATGTHIESGSTPGDPRGILLGIDVSRTESEDEARVTLGKASCHAGEFGACL